MGRTRGKGVATIQTTEQCFELPLLPKDFGLLLFTFICALAMPAVLILPFMLPDTRYAESFTAKGWNAIHEGQSVDDVIRLVGRPLEIRDVRYVTGEWQYERLGISVFFNLKTDLVVRIQGAGTDDEYSDFEGKSSDWIESKLGRRSRIRFPTESGMKGWCYSESPSGVHYFLRKLIIDTNTRIVLEKRSYFYWD